MTISEGAWKEFVDRLRDCSEAAARNVEAYFTRKWPQTPDEKRAAVDYCANVAEKYGTGAAAMACEMYDAVASRSRTSKPRPPAEPEDVKYSDVASAVYGTLKTSDNPKAVAGAVSRQVKLAGVDTTMKNAIRDGAEWAWIPQGDTCEFCLALASRGWQRASKEVLKGGHAEHIHNHCDCTFAIRFDKQTTVAGYHPKRLREIYDATEGRISFDKIRHIRKDMEISTASTSAPDARDRSDNVTRRGTDKMMHGFSCYGEHDVLRERSALIKPKPGYFDVSMHGTATAVCFGGRVPNMSPRTLAKLIKNNPDYNSSESIRLFCCSTGDRSHLADGEYCFAEELANATGKTVEAPDDLLYINSDGTWYVGIERKRELVIFKPNERRRLK